MQSLAVAHHHQFRGSGVKLVQFFKRADHLNIFTFLASPDRQRRPPKAFAGNSPVHVFFKPLTETSVFEIGRMPANLRVLGQHLTFPGSSLYKLSYSVPTRFFPFSRFMILYFPPKMLSRASAKISHSFGISSNSTVTYSTSGFTAKATFPGKVQGVVVQTRKLESPDALGSGLSS